MTSDIDTAIQWSKKLEALLEKQFGATGRGLHEKTDSVQEFLSIATVRNLHLIATVRNRIVHEPDYSQIKDRPGFERACSAVVAELDATHNQGRRTFPRQPSTPVAPNYPVRTRRNAVPGRVGPARGPGFRSRSLSPWLSIAGGIAGFTIPATMGEGFSPSLIGALVGAAVGFYWKVAVGFVLLGIIILTIFQLLMRAHESFH